MSKFTYTKFLGDFGNLRFIFDEETLKLDSQHSSKSATFTDRNGGEHIALSGSGLTYSKGGISGGEVEKITFENKHGDAMLTVTDGHWSASQITHMLTGKDGVEAFLDKIMAGKDTVKGSDRSEFLSGGAGDDKIDGGKGNDEIYGGKGNDHLHGGAGSDHFEFSPGRDVIDDFDASGGGMKQDRIVGNFDDVHFRQSGPDLVLSMDDGSSLVLLQTKMSAISAADFELF